VLAPLTPSPTRADGQDRGGRRLGAALGAVALALLLVSCSVTRGSGTVVSDEREVTAFDAIELSTSADVVVKAGDAPAVTVTGDDNVLDLLLTDVRDETLVIRTPTGRMFTTSRPVVVTAATPSIRRVAVSGSGMVTVTGVEADTLEVSVSGSGNVVTDGRAGSLRVAVSGSGNVSVGAVATLRADVSGSGNISYLGDPEVVGNVSGSGSIGRAG
jgi:hypothetical protein